MTGTGSEQGRSPGGGGRLAVLAVAAVAFAGGAGVVWLALGPSRPAGLPGSFHDPSVLFPAPAASMMTDAPPARDAALPDVDTMIAALAGRLEAAPDDPEGWKMLGWSYFSTGRFAEAAGAYARAVALLPPDAELLSLQGEALVRAAEGRVGTDTAALLDQSLALDPGNARSLYYRGLGLVQNGNPGEALKIWLPLLDAAPADTPWRDELRAGIRQAATAAGIDLSDNPGLAGSD
ncbi:MAG: tetratricopeptide repeat protein [Paracoccaceae bacterium]